MAGTAGPVETETSAVPADDGRSGITMTRTSAQRDQKRRRAVQNSRSIEFNAGRGRLRLSTADLLTEGEDFQGGVASPSKEDTEYRKHGEDEFGTNNGVTALAMERNQGLLISKILLLF